MEFLDNPWFVGIGGGILSGLVVALVTRFLFSKRDNREYQQKVAAANREVVYALRPGISEGETPSKAVLSSLMNATARKHRINKEDAFSAKEIAEELIKDIMDSNFISAETKKLYCENLAHLVQEETNLSELKENVELKDNRAIDYRQKLVLQMSVLLGVTVSMMTMTTVFIAGPERSSELPSIFPFTELRNVILPTLAALFAVIVSMFIAMVAVKFRKEKPAFKLKSKTSVKV
ncbi:hypothetical protein [Marinobacter salicampi]|uniref:hypothetical protein n=1 Tax=Marinobacter salicampi TaxID=435907 RepID=UPI001407E7E0|nr:hypothetical protein [Marinobacter salicampi]